MALFFDIEKLELAAGNDLKKFIELLQYHYSGLSSSKKYKPVKLPGYSYILNPSPLFETNEDKLFVVQYIKLAARRDYSLFKMHRYAKLDLSYFPEIEPKLFKHNPLLRLKDKELRFKYEEIYIKEKHSWQ